MTCLGVLDRGERGDDNGTGLKEGGGIEMSTTVLPLRDARSLRFEYLQHFIFAWCRTVIHTSYLSTVSSHNVVHMLCNVIYTKTVRFAYFQSHDFFLKVVFDIKFCHVAC